MTNNTYILGISAFYHDSAAALIKDGEIIAAAQEERFTRKKHDPSFPKSAIDYCLKEADIEVGDLGCVAYYEKSFIKFERLLYTYFTYAPIGLMSFLKAMPVWLKEKLFLRDFLHRELNYTGEILFTEHHEAHAASAFFPSPFQEAAIITLDGVGEWETTSFGFGRDNKIEPLRGINFPHSLGLLYSAFTYYAGFRVNSGEYKLMGLAPYGKPVYVDLIKEHLIDIKDDGSFKLNMKYFNYCVGLTMTNKHFHCLFDGSPRKPESDVTQKDMDIAHSIQKVMEEIILKMANHVYRETGMKNLCLAGGVALNCVGNGRILREGPFDEVWIQPAAGDAGGALGAALAVWYRCFDNPRKVDGTNDLQKGSYLGPKYSDGEIENLINETEAVYKKYSNEDLPKHIAQLVSEENVVGLFQGRMEFGPRALGGRSIIGDARSEKMQEIMNLKIKFRESFRPFAPSILLEKCSDLFELSKPSPYMLLVAQVKEDKINPDSRHTDKQGIDKLKVKRSVVPAITHVDYSARIQTVDGKTQSVFYNIIKEFDQLTGMPVIINTSFNIRGEPIVCTAHDAYRCFMCTDMDYLAIGNYIFDKQNQPHQDRYKKEDIVQQLD